MYRSVIFIFTALNLTMPVQVQAHATDWCELPAWHRAQCRVPGSPLRQHPGNCPAPSEMRECDVASLQICAHVHYNDIGLGYEELSRHLDRAIAQNSNSPYIEISPFPDGETTRVQKPIKLPAEKSLRQVGQQEYRVCLTVETQK